MTDRTLDPRVAILAHVGNGNMGDEAIVAAVIQNLRRRVPHAELYAITAQPADTRQRHGVPAYAVRPGSLDRRMADDSDGAEGRERATAGGDHPRRLKRVLQHVPGAVRAVRALRRVAQDVWGIPGQLAFLISSFRLLRGTDLLIVAGSAQLMDYWGGPWAFPFTLFKWSLLARIHGARLAFVSIGAGPLTTRTGKALIRRCLTWADYRSYREQSSRDLIRRLNVPGHHHLVPDLVFTLDWPDTYASRERDEPVVVGINPMPLFDGDYWPEADRKVYEQYLTTLAQFADWLIELRYAVSFFPTQLRVDPSAIDAIRSRMRHVVKDGSRSEQTIHSLEDLCSYLQRVDLVVATRYHGTLFPFLLGKPVLSIAYQPKTRDLMRLMGQEEYVIDFARLELRVLQERFQALTRREGEFKRNVEDRVRAVKEQVEGQYDQLLALIGVISSGPDGARPPQRTGRARASNRGPSGAPGES